MASSSKASTKKASGSKASGSTTTDAKPSGASAAAAKTAAAKKAAAKKAAAEKAAAKKAAAKKSGAKTSTAVVGVTPRSPAPGADRSSGTGSGPTEDRLAVVGVLRSYYMAFIESDGAQVCSLLTASGRGIMIRDGGAKTCAESVKRLVNQAGAQNLKLLNDTRDGLKRR